MRSEDDIEALLNKLGDGNGEAGKAKYDAIMKLSTAVRELVTAEINAKAVTPRGSLVALAYPMVLMAYAGASGTVASRSAARDDLGNLLDLILEVIDEGTRKSGMHDILIKLAEAKDRGDDKGSLKRMMDEAQAIIDANNARKKN